VLLLMTAVTGVVDAVSILSLGRVFVANMTGNVVFIALRSPAPRDSPFRHLCSRWRGSCSEP
jgi:hypothetical protein